MAIPVFHDRVAPRFDSGYGTIRLVEIVNRDVHTSEDITILDANPIDKMHHLAQIGVTTLICGGLTDTCTRELEYLNIDVFPWISGNINEVLDLYLHGKLKKHHSSEHHRKSSGKQEK